MCILQLFFGHRAQYLVLVVLQASADVFEIFHTMKQEIIKLIHVVTKLMHAWTNNLVDYTYIQASPENRLDIRTWWESNQQPELMTFF